MYFFVNAVAYVGGSLVGGFLTERLGRRTVLPLAVVLIAVGMIGLATAPSWELFLVAAMPFGLGTGAIDGGTNGLILDLYPTSRGRALNLAHLFFSVGALASPLVAGRLVEGGVPWQNVMLGTAAASGSPGHSSPWPSRFAAVASLVAAVALFAAVLVPSIPASIVLFGVVGFAFGPVYPLIMAVGGDLFPARSAAVSGFLSGFAVVGAIVYPPVMGFVSVGIGMGAAMGGAAVLAVACAVMLILVGRRSRSEPRRAATSI